MRHELLRQIHIEKRRTDRTGSPLSLVLIRIDVDGLGSGDRLSDFWVSLNNSKRETDFLGSLSDDQFGLLLPHTDQYGAREYIALLRRRFKHAVHSVTSVTYPDNVFEHLLSEETKHSEGVSLLVDPVISQTKIGSFAKRFVDVIGSIAILLLLTPLMLGAAIAVATTSPGPIIFQQTRLGRKGIPFSFYKFRSMIANVDDQIHRDYVASLIQGDLEQINQGDEERPVYKMLADPRITRVGRFIRKTSIDELPQLFNVLKGDMSLVGPRPPLLYEAEKYQSWHLRRILEVKPGITGLWQVEGRSTTSFNDMVRLDLRYVRTQSLWLDIRLLVRTVAVVLRHDGAA